MAKLFSLADVNNHNVCKYCDYNTESECPCCTSLGFEGFTLKKHDKEIEIKAITKCMDLVRDVMVDLDCVNATKYGNKNAKQQENSYSTIMRYEIADELDSLLDWMEQLKNF